MHKIVATWAVAEICNALFLQKMLTGTTEVTTIMKHQRCDVTEEV